MSEETNIYKRATSKNTIKNVERSDVNLQQITHSLVSMMKNI